MEREQMPYSGQPQGNPEDREGWWADIQQRMERLRQGKRLRMYLCGGALAMAALCTGIISGTYSYYGGLDQAVNQMQTRESGVALKEVFNPADLWVAGETKEKTEAFTNSGESAQLIRFHCQESWYDNQGTPEDLSDDKPWAYTGTYDPEPAVIHFTTAVTGTQAQWYYNAKDGWYYYLQVLEPGQVTDDVLDSVTFSSAISNAGPGAQDDFSNKRYSLTVVLESVGVNPTETEAAWGMRFVQDSEGTLSWTPVP